VGSAPVQSFGAEMSRSALAESPTRDNLKASLAFDGGCIGANGSCGDRRSAVAPAPACRSQRSSAAVKGSLRRSTASSPQGQRRKAGRRIPLHRSRCGWQIRAICSSADTGRRAAPWSPRDSVTDFLGTRPRQIRPPAHSAAYPGPDGLTLDRGAPALRPPRLASTDRALENGRLVTIADRYQGRRLNMPTFRVQIQRRAVFHPNPRTAWSTTRRIPS